VKLVAIFPWFNVLFALVAIGVLVAAAMRTSLRVDLEKRRAIVKEEKEVDGSLGPGTS